MEKKEKRWIFIIGSLAVFGIYMLFALLIYESDDSIKYEFYDVNDNYGTSSFCGEIREGTLSCLVNDTYVPVKQYSKL